MARILVAETIQYAQHQLIRVIEDLGHNYHEAHSGPEALDILRDKPVEMVLIDHHLKPDGAIPVIQKAKLTQPKLPFIPLTSSMEVATEQKLLGLGVSEYLTRPVEKEQLARLEFGGGL